MPYLFSKKYKAGLLSFVDKRPASILPPVSLSQRSAFFRNALIGFDALADLGRAIRDKVRQFLSAMQNTPKGIEGFPAISL